MPRLCVALLASLAVMPAGASAPPASEVGSKARATIVDAQGSEIGYATFEQAPIGVLIYIKVSGLTPGPHGLHLHDIAACDPEDKFRSAGGHVGLIKGGHGLRNPKGPEAGDLPNLFVGADGEGQGEFFTQLVSFDGSQGLAIFDENGTSLVIHENADDHLTQPIGGAGGRAACGVVTRE